MWDSEENCIHEQEIRLSREEFEFLKRQVAVRRGYVLQEGKGAEPPNDSESKRLPWMINDAETPGSRIAAELLIESSRRAFEGYLRGADPSELFLLIEILTTAESHLSLVYGIAVELDVLISGKTADELLHQAGKTA